MSQTTRALSTISNVSKGIQSFTGYAGLVAMTNPISLTDYLTSKNGMSDKEFSNWLSSVSQNAAFMMLGAGASKVGDAIGDCLRARTILNICKNGNKYDELTALINGGSSSLNIPDNVIKTLKHTNTAAKALGISAETFFDCISSYVLTKEMGGDFSEVDCLMSLAFAIHGGTLQKELSTVSDIAKASFIKNTLKDFKLDDSEAMMIVKYLEQIDNGTLKMTTSSTFSENADIAKNNALILPDLEINAKRTVDNTISPEILTQIQDLDFLQDIRQGDEIFYNKLCNNILEVITQDGCQDLQVLAHRLTNLDYKFVKQFCLNPKENTLFLLENKKMVSKISL